jgi:hypothetical protein
MGRRPKKKLTRDRLSSISANLLFVKGNGILPYANDPDLLRYMILALIFQLGRINKQREAQARRCLHMLAMRELMIDPDYEFKYFRGNYDARIRKSSLCSDPIITGLIKRLAEGRIQRSHDNEVIEFQNQLVCEYMRENRLPTARNPNVKKELYQKWLNTHWPQLLPLLTIIDCKHAYPPVTKLVILRSLKKGDEDPRYPHTPWSVRMVLLAHLHNGSSPGSIANLLKNPRASTHPPLM